MTDIPHNKIVRMLLPYLVVYYFSYGLESLCLSGYNHYHEASVEAFVNKSEWC